MKRFYRSRTDKKLGGVCGGIGKYFDVDPTVVRLLAVVLFFATGFFPLFIGYIAALILAPQEPYVMPPVDPVNPA